MKTLEYQPPREAAGQTGSHLSTRGSTSRPIRRAPPPLSWSPYPHQLRLLLPVAVVEFIRY
ncbi:hypothetical protein EYF80_062107 [Liparis tanakae]|uniref:Uncharacterized protein n=1 Tax=Liparis tanakae TaxID=230148 RepID=A0A4Z2EFU8_9TELE|nr:hypothetical protein EYF80_062107 [Liparis tanakae]